MITVLVVSVLETITAGFIPSPTPLPKGRRDRLTGGRHGQRCGGRRDVAISLGIIRFHWIPEYICEGLPPIFEGMKVRTTYCCSRSSGH